MAVPINHIISAHSYMIPRMVPTFVDYHQILSMKRISTRRSVCNLIPGAGGSSQIFELRRLQSLKVFVLEETILYMYTQRRSPYAHTNATVSTIPTYHTLPATRSFFLAVCSRSSCRINRYRH